MRHPIGVYLYGTWWFDLFAIGIASTQGRPWRWRRPVHVGIAFWLADLSMVGFEARCKGDRDKPAGGFFGPFDFVAKRRQYRRWPRRMWVRRLPVSVVTMQRMYAKCTELTETVKGYGKTQILAKWAHERFGWEMQTDPTIVDCSESAAMVLAVDPVFDLRDEFNRNFDAMTPYEVWTGTLNVLQRLACPCGSSNG